MLISYSHSCILIHLFIHILVHVYSFIYFLSFVIFFWLYVIIIIYNLTTLCVYDKLSFMPIFMFLFIFIFHITFMFHEHIYTYFISCLYLHPFLPCIPINFNQAISTLGATIQFSDKMWAVTPQSRGFVDFLSTRGIQVDIGLPDATSENRAESPLYGELYPNKIPA